MSFCLICGSECPPLVKTSRWGTERQFCSNRCIKTNYRQKNPEKDKAAKQKYVQNNPELRKESSTRYRKKNLSFYREYASLRSRRLFQAKPACLNEFDLLFLEEIYDLAGKRGLEVDHIVPLKHPLVCGLHVPENLQLLTRSENARKNNRFDEDLICIVKE